MRVYHYYISYYMSSGASVNGFGSNEVKLSRIMDSSDMIRDLEERISLDISQAYSHEMKIVILNYQLLCIKYERSGRVLKDILDIISYWLVHKMDKLSFFVGAFVTLLAFLVSLL